MISFNKYAGVPVKVTKLMDNKFGNDHPNKINEGYEKIGFVNVKESNDIQSLLVIGEGRFFHTSHVQSIEEFEGFDLLTTLNSVYRVEPILHSIPGVQQKYSVKLISDESEEAGQGENSTQATSTSKETN